MILFNVGCSVQCPLSVLFPDSLLKASFLEQGTNISIALFLFCQYKRIAQDLHKKSVTFRIVENLTGLF